jgi:tRNA(fMet)-specific endonuclease VapC
VLPFDELAAEVYGPLRARLESEGRRLDEPDLRIASIVLARDLTLVTGNERHFARVPDLRIENWLTVGG